MTRETTPFIIGGSYSWNRSVKGIKFSASFTPLEILRIRPTGIQQNKLYIFEDCLSVDEMLSYEAWKAWNGPRTTVFYNKNSLAYCP